MVYFLANFRTAGDPNGDGKLCVTPGTPLHSAMVSRTDGNYHPDATDARRFRDRRLALSRGGDSMGSDLLVPILGAIPSGGPGLQWFQNGGSIATSAIQRKRMADLLGT